METKKKNKKTVQWIILSIVAIPILVFIFVSFLFRSCATRAPELAVKPRFEEIKITVRDYLLRGENEEVEYGLYSYLLFSRKPVTEKEVDRYLALHEAYRTLHSYKEFEYSEADSILSKRNINITYWPLQIKFINDQSIKDSLEFRQATDRFFINEYDYFRADLILKEIQGITTSGPFIIAYYYPLTNLPQEPDKDEMLIIDLSRIERGQFVHVLGHFQRKVVEDPKTWKNKFEWELIRIHIYSAVKLHGEPILYAAKWVGGFFDVKKAFAKP